MSFGLGKGRSLDAGEAGFDISTLPRSDEGRLHPLDQGRVGLPEQAQGLGKVPTRKIQIPGNRNLVHISHRRNPQIVLAAPQVNKSDIKITIGGLKPPRATPGLASPKNGDALAGGEGFQFGTNQTGLRRGDAHDSGLGLT